MRVIAGQWRGRRLKSPLGDHVRPTTDRVKEALFNILGPVVRDCLFLDLCCGAGGLGIEALSRGADSVIFIDNSARSLELVAENLELCGGAGTRTRLVRADATTWLSAWKPPAGQESWVLVADPPYRSGAAGAIMKEMERLAGETGFRAGIIEHGIRTPGVSDQEHGSLSWQTRRYGESRLAIVRAPGNGARKGE